MNEPRIPAVGGALALAVALGLGAPAVAAEPAAPLSLPDAWSLALLESPELEVFSLERRTADARTLQASQIPNPQLDLRLYRLRPATADSTDPDEQRRRVILSQPIELGGKRERRRDLALAEREIAGHDYAAKRAQVAASVAERFAVVLGAQRRLASARRHFDYVGDLVERVRTLAGSGELAVVDVQRLERHVGLARIELARAESELGAARLRLTAVWNNPAPAFTEAVGDLEALPEVPAIEEVLGLVQSSPALARWETELERGEAALALAKANRVPDLNYGVGVRWENDFARRDYLVELEIDLPIFDRKQGDVRGARGEIDRAKAARRAAEAASQERVADLYYRLVEADARRAALRDQVLPATRATFETHERGFATGAGDLDDLVKARRDLAESEFDYADALVDCHAARAGLEGLLGTSLGGAP